MKNQKKILFAAVDIGYRIENYTKYISENFSDILIAESFSKYILPESHYKTKYTYTCPINKTHPLKLYFYCFFFFIYSLFRYDIFHFISGETILTRKLRTLELAIYKLLNKRVVMHFVGSDIRSEDYIYWKRKHILQFLEGIDNFPKSLPWQKKLIADAEKYADYILVSTPDLKELIPKSIYYPVVLDLNKYLEELNQIKQTKKAKGEIVILHSPSTIKNEYFKGTDYIIETLTKIAANPKYNIRLILPSREEKARGTNYSSTRYELFQHFKDADIVIDQLVSGWYGLLSIEALAAENQVICYVDNHLKPYLYPNCPIEIANVNTLESAIVKCIENIINENKIKSLSQIEWIRKYHTIEFNHNSLLKAWNISKIESIKYV